MRRLPLLFGGHSLVRPALRAFFRPDRRCPTPPPRRACQGWPRLRGHPLGLGLDWPEHGGRLASGPPLEAKGTDLSRPAEAPRTRAKSSRNGGRHHLGMVGGIIVTVR